MDQDSTGIFYFVVHYPGFINLPTHKFYGFEFEESKVGFQVLSHCEPLHYVGFQKTLKEDQQVQFSSTDENQVRVDFTTIGTDRARPSQPRKMILNQQSAEIAFSRQYTELMVCRAGCAETSQDDLKPYEILDFIVNQYRVSSADFRIPTSTEFRSDFPLIRVAFREFDETDKTLSPAAVVTQSRTVRLKLHSTFLKLFDDYESTPIASPLPIHEIDKRFSAFIQNSRSSRKKDYYQGLGRAIRALVSKDYKFSFLESFMLVEILTSDFVRFKKLEKGVSKSKLDQFAKDLRVSYMLNVEVPIFLDAISQSTRSILGRVDSLRKKRNLIVHEGHSVTEEEARSAIESVQAYCEILDRNEAPDRRRHLSL